MTFGTFSLNYTHNMSIHPLIWTWMFKVGPLPTFLSKKIKTFSEYFNATKHTRTHVYWGRGIHYRGCTFIAGGVHTRMHMYWGRGIHYRGCTFIAGGVHTRTHVYWRRGINYRGCTFIAGGVHTRTHILPQPVKNI